MRSGAHYAIFGLALSTHRTRLQRASNRRLSAKVAVDRSGDAQVWRCTVQRDHQRNHNTQKKCSLRLMAGQSFGWLTGRSVCRSTGLPAVPSVGGAVGRSLTGRWSVRAGRSERKTRQPVDESV